MIQKREWEKSFKNVNGREPNEQEYQQAVSEGLVKEEVIRSKNDKRTIIIVGSILGTLLAIIIAILLTIFFYPKPSNDQTATFNDGSSKSTLRSASTSMAQSTSLSEHDRQVLMDWDRLSLNQQIALLAQTYAGINPQTTLLSAEKIAMTANGNAGVNDGYIQWYDDTNVQHKLDVVINNNTVIFNYIDNMSGQPQKKEAKINSLLSTYYQNGISKQTTDNIALKVVTPAELQSSDPKSIIYEALINKGFRRSLVSYDGMDVDTAMKTGAPQNLAHDGTQYYYFESKESVKTTGVGNYAYSANHPYKITDTDIEIGYINNAPGNMAKIPYRIENGSVVFEASSVNFEGHNIVFSFTKDPTAKDYIYSKKESQ
ncbi:hypothetical protein [Lactococcus formosensis]|uniref:hypothetical protein n=1 Tax=Lactococcus formosensis TaxID=1281486 RepID=UPI0022DF469D|nr:hypothetical protein [Lactococcus formosensis]MDT2725410.1 hypothetical protein [Lactococcus formosensis]